MRLPVEHAHFQPLADTAMKEWCSGAEVDYVPLKSEGFSGAAVLKVDIRSSKPEALPSGQYILKLAAVSKAANEGSEIEAHKRALHRNPEFADAHIPNLERSLSTVIAAPDPIPGYVMLFEVAGRSLSSHQSAEVRHSNLFSGVCSTLSFDLLEAWSDPEPGQRISISHLLERWLGGRLSKPRLRDFVAAYFGTGPIRVISGQILVNPLFLHDLQDSTRYEELAPVDGLLHGDLHLGNILIHKRDPENQPYWVIDFGQSFTGPIGFDQAYMEIALILDYIGSDDLAPLLHLLKALDQATPESAVPPRLLGLADYIRRVRSAQEKWIQRRHPRRSDDLHRQFLLSRVAAGLNWANKRIDEPRRHLGLCYSAWAAAEYLRLYEEKEWQRVTSGSPVSTVGPTRSSEKSADDRLWDQLWSVADGFSQSRTRFILVSERLAEDEETLSVVGKLPWSGVIDLDPGSDAHGLYKHAGAVLSTYRGVHLFVDTKSVRERLASDSWIDTRRGTGWMLATGSSLRSEPPTDLATWKRHKLPEVRDFLKMLYRQIHPDRLVVILLPGSSVDTQQPAARISKVAEALDEVTKGEAVIIRLGDRSLIEDVRHIHIPLDPSVLLHRLKQAYGVSPMSLEPSIPGGQGRHRLVPIDTLRVLQENFEVLHSKILDDPLGEQASERPAFWRGSTPSWFDLHVGNDVQRTLNSKLVATLRTPLEESRNYTVVLHHLPGTGGTTAALRAAWDLRQEFPTAVLTSFSDALPARLQSLFNLAEKPVLLVAEASRLSEAHLNDLYRDLSQRNVRVVVLYVKRKFGSAEVGSLTLDEPMTVGEARHFCQAYIPQTRGEHDRAQELRRITEHKELSRYRIPFYYGLIAFQREFCKIQDYVASHLEGVHRRSRNLLEYLAVLTIFTDTGIPLPMIARLAGLSANTRLTLSDIFGDKIERLLVDRGGRYRVMHQVLAEEILARLLGGGTTDWKFELQMLSEDLIRDVSSAADPTSSLVRDIFQELFINRASTGGEDAESREDFAPLIETLDRLDSSFGQQVLKTLTQYANEAHFWNHLGRHQIYRIGHSPELAEEYLLRATNLSPEDYLHYHTLGVVRRHRVRQAIKGLKLVSPAELLKGIEPHYTGAVEAFDKTRLLNPENIYGHITHVQMILEVARALKGAAGVQSLAQIVATDASVSDWIDDNLCTAEHLLNEARQLYGTLEQPDRYFSGCHADLKALYGDIDEVIRIWELANARGRTSASSRRALVNAYLVRGERRWSALTVPELRRITELMEENLRSSWRRDDDYRFWFECSRLLPEFDTNEAIARLRQWSTRFPSWRAHYYLYVMYFYLWFTGRTESPAQMESALEECDKMSVGRKTFSSNWWGYVPDHCPLVPEGELGEWDRESRFWKVHDQLRPVNGVIDSPITGPQSGTILIDGKLKAHFVPGKDFIANQDENKPVNFLMGFSPRGLRAWMVKHGHVAGSNRVGTQPQYAMSEAAHSNVPDVLKVQVARNVQIAEIRQFCQDFILARMELGAGVPLLVLENRLCATFGVAEIRTALADADLESFLRHSGQYRLSVVEAEVVIRPVTGKTATPARGTSGRVFGVIQHYDSSRGFGFIVDDLSAKYYFRDEYVRQESRSMLSSRKVPVEFTISRNEQGPVALSVRILESNACWDSDGLIPTNELRSRVEAKIYSILEIAMSLGRQHIDVYELERELSRLFRGSGRLSQRLGMQDVHSLCAELPQLKLERRGTRTLVALSRALGRADDGPFDVKSVEPSVLPLVVRPPQPTIPASKTDLAWFTETVLDVLRTTGATERPVPLLQVASKLGYRIPKPSEVVKTLGFGTFLAFLRSLPGIEIHSENPAYQKVRLYSSDVTKNVSSGDRARTGPPVKTTAVRPKPESISRTSTPDGMDQAAFARTVRDVLRAHGAGDNPMPLLLLASQIGKRVRGPNALARNFGFESFLIFLGSLPDVEVAGDPAHRIVRLRPTEPQLTPVPDVLSAPARKPEIARREYHQPGVRPHRPTPTVRGRKPTKEASEQVSPIAEVVIALVTSSPQQRLKVTQIAHKLTAQFPGPGKLAVRLGGRTMREVLKNIPQIRVLDDHAIDPTVCLSEAYE